MRNRRLHRAARGGAHPARGPRPPRVPRLRLGRHRAGHDATATCSSRSAPASWPTCARRSSTARPSAAVGLAHTRWATHGRPNDLNAHPHTDCTGQITVIHNGIIENFKALRDGLRDARPQARARRPTPRRSRTSSRRPTTATSPTPSRAALRQAHGAYAVAVMHAAEPDRLVGARLNVPLIVGLGDGENFLASDVAAVLAHTRRVIFLEEGDVADITADVGRRHRRRRHRRASAWCTTSTGRSRRPRRAATRISCSRRCTSSPRRSARRSPAASTTTTIELDELEPIADAPREGRARRVRRLRHAPTTRRRSARTSSRTGCTCPARWNIGSEFRYSPPPLDERTLVVAVTQSGETADTIAPTRYARQQGCPIIAVTNTVGSAITREADAVLFLQAGPEIAVVATKTFATQVTTLVLLAAAMAKLRGRLPRERERQLVAELRALPDKAQRALDLAEPAKELARRYVNSRGFMFVGRGIDLSGRARGRAEAQGGQLRPRRGLRRGRAQARAHLAARRRGAARRHRDALVGPGEADQQRHGGSRARRARAGRRDRGRRARCASSPTTSCGCPRRSRSCSPILAAIPLQLFAYHTAVARGTDVDQPRNLAKSVTVE